MRSVGPLFQQLARRMIEAIGRGDYPVGTQMPTEAEIATKHGVSRHTVRDALAELRAMGLVESRQGMRSTVLRRHPSAAYTETYSNVEELIDSAHGTPIHALNVEEIVADEALSAWLRGQAGQAYLKVTGIRRSTAAPDAPAIGHVEVFVDATYSGVRDVLPTLRTSMAEALGEMYALSVARIEQEITAALLPEEVASALDAPAASPALSILRWYYGANGRIFEVALSRYPIGRFVYRNALVRRTK